LLLGAIKINLDDRETEHRLLISSIEFTRLIGAGNPGLPFFKQAGFNLTVRSRSYFPSVDDPELEVVLMRAIDACLFQTRLSLSPPRQPKRTPLPIGSQMLCVFDETDDAGQDPEVDIGHIFRVAGMVLIRLVGDAKNAQFAVYLLKI